MHPEKERRVESRSRVARKQFRKAIWHSRNSHIDFEVSAFTFVFVSIQACTSLDAWMQLYFAFLLFVFHSIIERYRTWCVHHVTCLIHKITHASDFSRYLQQKGLLNYYADDRYNLVQSIVWILPWWKAAFVMPSFFFFFFKDFFNFGVLQKYRR